VPVKRLRTEKCLDMDLPVGGGRDGDHDLKREEKLDFHCGSTVGRVLERSRKTHKYRVSAWKGITTVGDRGLNKKL